MRGGWAGGRARTHAHALPITGISTLRKWRHSVPSSLRAQSSMSRFVRNSNDAANRLRSSAAAGPRSPPVMSSIAIGSTSAAVHSPPLAACRQPLAACRSQLATRSSPLVTRHPPRAARLYPLPRFPQCVGPRRAGTAAGWTAAGASAGAQRCASATAPRAHAAHEGFEAFFLIHRPTQYDLPCVLWMCVVVGPPTHHSYHTLRASPSRHMCASSAAPAGQCTGCCSGK